MPLRKVLNSALSVAAVLTFDLLWRLQKTFHAGKRDASQKIKTRTRTSSEVVSTKKPNSTVGAERQEDESPVRAHPSWRQVPDHTNENSQIHLFIHFLPI